MKCPVCQNEAKAEDMYLPLARFAELNKVEQELQKTKLALDTANLEVRLWKSKWEALSSKTEANSRETEAKLREVLKALDGLSEITDESMREKRRLMEENCKLNEIVMKRKGQI